MAFGQNVDVAWFPGATPQVSVNVSEIWLKAIIIVRCRACPDRITIERVNMAFGQAFHDRNFS
jgi:hypothetical protein